MFGSSVLILSLQLIQDGEAVAIDPVTIWRAMGWPTRVLVVLVGITVLALLGKLLSRE